MIANGLDAKMTDETGVKIMQITVDLDMTAIEKVVNQAITAVMVCGAYPSERGTVAKYIASKTEETLKAEIDKIDFSAMVRTLFDKNFKAITTDVVRSEIEKMARKALKELKANGELLSTVDSA